MHLLAFIAIAVTSLHTAGDMAPITGPENVRPGSLVRVSANLASGHTADWSVFPFQLDHEITKDGQLLFAAPCSGVETVYVELRDLWVDANTNTVHTKKTRHTIQIERSGPGPIPPDPPPIPNPDPPTPPEELDGIALVAFVAAAALPEPARALTPRIGQNFKATASAIAAGTVSSIDDGLAQVQRANAATVGDAHRETWAAALDAIGLRWRELQNAQLICSLEDAATEMRNVARGLAAVPATASLQNSTQTASPPTQVPDRSATSTEAPVVRRPAVAAPAAYQPATVSPPVRYRSMCIGGRCYLVPIPQLGSHGRVTGASPGWRTPSNEMTRHHYRKRFREAR